MKRPSLFAAIAALIFSSPAIAADNGGFGAAFNNKPPSALAETPNSQIAQTVTNPRDPSAEELQTIMPAAGAEDDAQPSVVNGLPVIPQNKPESMDARDPIPNVPGRMAN